MRKGKPSVGKTIPEITENFAFGHRIRWYQTDNEKLGSEIKAVLYLTGNRPVCLGVFFG